MAMNRRNFVRAITHTPLMGAGVKLGLITQDTLAALPPDERISLTRRWFDFPHTIDKVFTHALGSVPRYHRQAIRGKRYMTYVLLQEHEDLEQLIQHETLKSLLSVPDNVEANFYNYKRLIVPPNKVPELIIDKRGVTATLPELTWYEAGVWKEERDGTYWSGVEQIPAHLARNNHIRALLICSAKSLRCTDKQIIPLTYHQFEVTTDGNGDITAHLGPGYYRAING